MVSKEERRLVADSLSATKLELNMLRRENACYANLASSVYAELAASVTRGQATLGQYQWSHAILVSTDIPHTERAVLAHATQLINLACASFLVISRGYSRQAGPLLRSLYECLALTCKARTDEPLARKILKDSLRPADSKKLVETMVSAVIPLTREWASETGGCLQASETESQLRIVMRRWYGDLSKVSHPISTGLGTQFRLAQDIGASKYGWGAEPEVGEVVAHHLGQLWHLQRLVGIVLILATKSMPYDKYQELQTAWATYISSDLRLVPRLIDLFPSSSRLPLNAT